MLLVAKKCVWDRQAVATVTQLNGFKGKFILDNSNGQGKAVGMLGTFTSSGVGHGEVGLLSVKGHAMEIQDHLSEALAGQGMEG